MSEPIVSVILPVYQNMDCIRDTVQSLQRQTLKDIEIIFVDDGSTDQGPRILEEYAEKDPRIRVEYQAHQNAGAARNRGIDLASGTFLCFLDADDLFDPELLETGSRVMTDERSDVLVFPADRFHTETGETELMPWSFVETYLPDHSPFSPDEMKRHLFNSFQNWPWNKMFRSSFVHDRGLRFQEIPRTNDMYFTCMALAQAERISVLKKTLVHYRIGRSTNSQSTNFLYPTSFWEAYLKTWQGIQALNLHPDYSVSLLNKILNGIMYNINTLVNTDVYEEVRQFIRDNAEKEFHFLDCAPEDYDDPAYYQAYLQLIGKGPKPTLKERIHAHLSSRFGKR